MTNLIEEGRIEEELNRVLEMGDAGKNKWPGMTYVEGVRNALEWVLGYMDEAPMDDE